MNRLRKILKGIWIVAGAAINILLLVNAYFVWSTGSELERRLAALRSAGDPVQLADLAREPIPSDRNADVFLRRAADDLDAVEKELLAMYPKKGYSNGNLSPAEQDELENLFAAYPKVMPLLEQAAACPDADPQLDVSPPTTRFLQPYMDRSGKHRLVNRVLRTRCALLLSKGRVDDALANQMLMLRLTRHWRREPLIFAYLVTAVCEMGAMEGVNHALRSSGPVSPASRRAIDTELALHDTMAGYDWALRSERAYSLSSVQEIPGSSFWLTRGFANQLALGLMDLYDRHLARGLRAYADVVAGKGPASVLRRGPNPYGALVTLLEPALNAAREPAERTRAMSRSLRVLNALQSQVPTQSALVPKLTELGLPEEATIDPYNGEPLHVNKRPDGWMVYSVGNNLVDDGGTFDGNKDIGSGPIGPKEPKKKP
jgi:hypothetical protein